jgi:hypothetical protein
VLPVLLFPFSFFGLAFAFTAPPRFYLVLRDSDTSLPRRRFPSPFSPSSAHPPLSGSSSELTSRRPDPLSQRFQENVLEVAGAWDATCSKRASIGREFQLKDLIGVGYKIISP